MSLLCEKMGEGYDYRIESSSHQNNLRGEGDMAKENEEKKEGVISPEDEARLRRRALDVTSGMGLVHRLLATLDAERAKVKALKGKLSAYEDPNLYVETLRLKDALAAEQAKVEELKDKYSKTIPLAEHLTEFHCHGCGLVTLWTGKVPEGHDAGTGHFSPTGGGGWEVKTICRGVENAEELRAALATERAKYAQLEGELKRFHATVDEDSAEFADLHDARLSAAVAEDFGELLGKKSGGIP